ncbi:unnamed protein product [Pedinophyceae sp. YPF-701]|nr:unnamed protein product [Pedinophyceae sp. YPF-701]
MTESAVRTDMHLPSVFLSPDQNRLVNDIVVSWLVLGETPPGFPRGGVVAWPDRPSPKGPGEAQGPAKTVKDINTARGYPPKYDPSAREFVQNWIDEARSLATVQPGCSDPGRTRGQRKCPENSGYFEAIQRQLGGSGIDTLEVLACPMSGGRHVLLGVMVQAVCRGKRVLELINLRTHISFDDLVIGNSSGKENSYSAGYFGEGLKVSINVMTTAGADVGIKTRNAEWRFAHLDPKTMQPCAAKSATLHAVSVRQAKGVEHVVVAVQSTQDVLGGPYLFLEAPLPPASMRRDPETKRFELVLGPDAPQKISLSGQVEFDGQSEEFSVDVLIGTQSRGKIYAHGILLKTNARLSFGIDFTGPSHHLTEIGVKRDRSDVDVDKLIAAFADLARWRGTQDDLMAHFDEVDATQRDGAVKVLYIFLFDALNSDAESNGDLLGYNAWAWTRPSAFLELWRGLLQALRWTHRNNDVIPVTASDKETRSEVELLWKQPAEVGNKLYEKWHGQKGLLKPLDEYWAEFRAVLKDMREEDHFAEAQQWWEKVKEYLDALRADMEKLFHGLVKREEIKFLNLRGDEGRHGRVLVFLRRKRPDEENLVVIDKMYVFNLDACHEKLEEDWQTPCQNTQLGACGCLRNLIFEELIKQSSRDERERDKIRRRATACILRHVPTGYMPDELKRTKPLAQTNADARRTQSAATNNGEQTQATGDSPQKGQRSAVESPQTESGDRHGSAGGSAAGQTGSSRDGAVVEHTEAEPRRGETDFRGVEDGAGEPVGWHEDVRRGFVASMESVSPPDGQIHAPGGLTRVEETVSCCSGIDLTYDLLGICLDPPFTGGKEVSAGESFPVGIWTNEATVQAKPDENEVRTRSQGLSNVVYWLLSEVCREAYAVDAAVLRYNIFYDPASSNMAFNRGGGLWFNADFFGRRGQTPDDEVREWFLTVLHELAHNRVKGHNSAFAGEMARHTLHVAPYFNKHLEDERGPWREGLQGDVQGRLGSLRGKKREPTH